MLSVNELEDRLIDLAFAEDIGDGDHTTLCCIPEDAMGKSHLLIKEDGILAGVEVAKKVFERFDPEMQVEVIMGDGSRVKKGDIAMIVTGRVRSLLQTERLMLNIMQRMSGIATMTNKYVERLKGTHTHVLDTRKTTPGMRMLEKAAVKIGGGVNHRIGLFDMILLKDNHVDFSGGIKNSCGVEPPANRVGERVRLLEDLLDHEVLVAAFFYRADIPVHLLHFAGDGRVVESVDVDAVRRDARDIAVLEVDDLAGVRDYGRHVARDDDVVFSNADDERASLASNDHLARMLCRYCGDAVSSLDALERLGCGCQEVALVKRGDQVCDDFGVGLRKELYAALLESRAERRVVLDYAVVDEGEIAAIGYMRVRVGYGRKTVRRPTRVRDADRVFAALVFWKRP